mgnify:CR=1 FL=1
MLVSVLVRRASQCGGAAVVVARGDANAGSILLLCLERGQFVQYLERALDGDGHYRWQAVGPADDTTPESHAWLERRRARDPDMWLVELDVAQPQRFAAETSGDG